MEDLSILREEINQLHDRTQNTKSDLRVLQTKFDERNTAILEKIDRLETEMSLVLKKLNELNDLANSGKTSIRTLWFLGGLVAATLATLATWLDIFR